MIERPGSKTPAPVTVYQAGRAVRRADVVATEEPLEIRLEAGRQKRTLAVTMRTPGADFELAAGFLYGEGVVSDRREIREIAYCVDRELDEEQRYNVVNAKLRTNELPELATLERHFLTSSACGVCGKANLEQLHIRGCSWPVTTRTVSP